MPKITRNDVEHVAALAQLSPDEATKDRLLEQMNDILAYMDKLKRNWTRPKSSRRCTQCPMTNVFRDDVLGASLEREQGAEKRGRKRTAKYSLCRAFLDVDNTGMNCGLRIDDEMGRNGRNLTDSNHVALTHLSACTSRFCASAYSPKVSDLCHMKVVIGSKSIFSSS